MPSVTVGDHVLAKHKNGRYYRAVVVSVSKICYYKVAFDDGSYSNDMYPQDIEVTTRIHLHWHCVCVIHCVMGSSHFSSEIERAGLPKPVTDIKTEISHLLKASKHKCAT